MNIPCIPQSAFMLEADFLKATLGCAIASLNHGIHSMQVIDRECQGGETSDCRCSQSFVLILFFANDNAYFAASMGSIKVFQRTVADEDCISVHCK
jgi:hypothetical protein